MLSAYILINTAAGKEKEVLESLNSNASVVDVSIVYGQYDLIAKVFLDDASDLPSFIMEIIRPLDGITGTSTLLAAFDSSHA
jgi:anthranilate phosphoribosyltransferase